MSKPQIEIGIQVLPQPIQQYILQSVRTRAVIPCVYHITELTSQCQRKSFFKRQNPAEKFDLESALNIYRGSNLDHEWCRLFEHNQEPVVAYDAGSTIVGTYDFIHDGFLYDLKAPKTIFYKARDGVGLYYRRQVQAYLSILHHNGRYPEVHAARVLMVADNCLLETVPADDDYMWSFLWRRCFALDEALARGCADRLPRSESPEWECKPKYCDFTVECAKT